MAAGPNALRGSGPNPSRAFDDAMTLAGSPNPRKRPYLHYIPSCPRQSSLKLFVFCPSWTTAGSNLGSLNCSPRTIMAQAIRAILLASATAATLIGRRLMIRASQSRFFVPRRRAVSDDSHCARNEQPSQISVALFSEIPPSPLLAACRMLLGNQGQSRPQVAAGSRRLSNPPTSATRVVATIGPMPGISSSCRLSAHPTGARHGCASQ